VIAAISWIEDEGLGGAGELVFSPKSFDQFVGSHAAAGADVELSVS